MDQNIITTTEASIATYLIEHHIIKLTWPKIKLREMGQNIWSFIDQVIFLKIFYSSNLLGNIEKKFFNNIGFILI